jgi:NAD(P)H dehydrogenase (quinone)
MSIVVTGVTGHLGRHAVGALLARGVAPSDIVATGRSVERLGDLAERGVHVRQAAYTDPDSLRAAFADAEKLLFVSGSEVGQRVEQHRNVIEAALKAGIGLVAYTSITRAESTRLLLAPEHLATEQALGESGLAHVVLRNSWYLENYTEQLPAQLQSGAVIGAAGDGRVSAAARRDYAEAAVVTLLEDGHAGRVYELGGDHAFTMTEYAETVSRHTGQTIVYRDLPVEELAATLAGFGIPEDAATVYADSDAGVARGELLVESGDLSRLTGHPTVTLDDAVAAAVARLRT